MAFKDYYATLGLPADATREAIRLAYRRLASQHHPDRSRAEGAEERFKAINEAHEVLSDPARRATYDQLRREVQLSPELRATTRRGFDEILSRFTGLRGKPRDPAWRETLRGFFSDAGLAGQATRPKPTPRRGEDQSGTLALSLEDMVLGAYRECVVRVEVSDEDGLSRPVDKRVKVRIPAGITPGKRIRLAGMGGEGETAGDLLLTVTLAPHPHFILDGRDVILRLPLAPWEAALGATLLAPTPHGAVRLKVPAGAQSGQRLRLAGKGLPGQPAGDLLVELQIHVPSARTPEARAFYQEMAATLPFNPRESMGY